LIGLAALIAVMLGLGAFFHQRGGAAVTESTPGFAAPADPVTESHPAETHAETRPVEPAVAPAPKPVSKPVTRRTPRSASATASKPPASSPEPAPESAGTSTHPEDSKAKKALDKAKGFWRSLHHKKDSGAKPEN
jgi:hypothetical protein